jgi:hypothetical protein
MLNKAVRFHTVVYARLDARANAAFLAVPVAASVVGIPRRFAWIGRDRSRQLFRQLIPWC